jgi:hypothetical protein
MENNLEIIEVSTYQKNVVFEKTINFELNDIDYEYSYLQTDENLYINIVDEEVGLDILAIHNDEKYVNKLIVDEDLFNLFKENNMIDKNENYNDFKDLSKEIVVLSDEYPYDDVHEVNFIYNHNEYCYMSGENKETITLEFNGHNDLVFEKKKNIVGSGVDVIHYNNKLFDEDFFKALKNNDITSNLFGDKDYKQFCENSIDVANDKESVDLER